MKSTRSLDSNEIHRVSAAFIGAYEVRNIELFILGVLLADASANY